MNVLNQPLPREGRRPGSGPAPVAAYFLPAQLTWGMAVNSEAFGLVRAQGTEKPGFV